MPFALAHPDEIVRSRSRQLHRGIDFVESAVELVDIETNTVQLAEGDALTYDVLIVASGAVLVPEETEGMIGPGWMERVFTLKSSPLASSTRAPPAARSSSGRTAYNRRSRRSKTGMDAAKSARPTTGITATIIGSDGANGPPEIAW